jgi:hypothetical protein
MGVGVGMVVQRDAEAVKYLRDELANVHECLFCAHTANQADDAERDACFVRHTLANDSCSFVKKLLEYLSVGATHGLCGVCFMNKQSSSSGGVSCEAAGGSAGSTGGSTDSDDLSSWVCWLENRSGYGYQCGGCGLADCRHGASNNPQGPGADDVFRVCHPVAIAHGPNARDCPHRLLSKAAGFFLRTEMGWKVLKTMAAGSIIEDALNKGGLDALMVLGHWLTDTSEPCTELSRLHGFVYKCAQRWRAEGLGVANCAFTGLCGEGTRVDQDVLTTLHGMREHTTSTSPRKFRVLVYIVKRLFSHPTGRASPYQKTGLDYFTDKGQLTFKIACVDMAAVKSESNWLTQIRVLVERGSSTPDFLKEGVIAVLEGTLYREDATKAKKYRDLCVIFAGHEGARVTAWNLSPDQTPLRRVTGPTATKCVLLTRDEAKKKLEFAAMLPSFLDSRPHLGNNLDRR